MSLYKRLSTILILVYATSCTQDKKASDNQNVYFDIRGFFSTEAARFNEHSSPVIKRVNHNGKVEEKRLKIADWKQELELFISSDINKPSWRNSYSTEKDKNVTTYKAIDTSLKVREIRLQREGKKMSSIRIINRVNNEIYSSTETLTYYPDSLYVIDKEQNVRGLGQNSYKITGKIKP